MWRLEPYGESILIRLFKRRSKKQARRFVSPRRIGRRAEGLPLRAETPYADKRTQRRDSCKNHIYRELRMFTGVRRCLSTALEGSLGTPLRILSREAVTQFETAQPSAYLFFTLSP